MIKDYLLDIHTHTLASGHAFSSLQEMVHAAAEKQIKLLGVTEHGPGIPGTCDPIYFRNMHCVPRMMYGVELLMGAELNIIDYKGTILLDDVFYPMLDVKIAGLHGICYKPGTIEENTSAMLGAIKNPLINIISHPGDGTAELNFEPLVLASKQYHTLLEINNSSLNPVRHREKARPNNLEILRLCKKYEVPVIVGSDAHISFDIAKHQWVDELIQEVDFPDALIINDKIELFKKVLKKQDIA
jgi:putative hydrolase